MNDEKQMKLFVDLFQTNLDGSKFPWNSMGCPSHMDCIKRWNIEKDLINVDFSRVDPIHLKDLKKSLSIIEKKLKTKIFREHTVTSRGLIISSFTTKIISKDFEDTGTVSMGPFETRYPDSFYSTSGEIDTVLYVNIGNKNRSPVSREIMIHELGHALGLGGHFDGFGDEEGPIGKNFWNVLRLLYHCKIGDGSISVSNALKNFASF